MSRGANLKVFADQSFGGPSWIWEELSRSSSVVESCPSHGRPGLIPLTAPTNAPLGHISMLPPPYPTLDLVEFLYRKQGLT